MDLRSIVLQLIAAIGGIGFVFTAFVGFSSNIIADKLQKKYQLKLSEELEKYKAGLTSKTHVSKTKFDAEFSIYKNLTLAFSQCVKSFNILIPNGMTSVPANKEEKRVQDERNYTEARKAYVIAQDELSKSIPFIPKEFCDDYKELLMLCGFQLSDFEQRWNVGYLVPQEKKETLGLDSYNRTRDINQKFDVLNEKIRDYLAQLDVL